MSDRDQRILDLLALQASEGLDPTERDTLDGFCRAEAQGIQSLESAAAAIDLAYVRVEEPLPAALGDRIREQLHLAASTDAATDGATDSSGEDSTPLAPPIPFARPQTEAAPAKSLSSRVAWLAAAAALVIAILTAWPRTELLDIGPAGGPRTAADLRGELLSGSTDTLQISWQATEDPVAQNATGDVVWSRTRQRGFMRFTGLEANDPEVTQYQLWIFDENQDERFPIDGGVFDVDGSGEVVIPIEAKLRVQQPTLFAVTVEKPGGVVVSSRERIVLVGAVG